MIKVFQWWVVFLFSIFLSVTYLGFVELKNIQESQIKTAFMRCIENIKIPVGECSKLFEGEK